ncbi:phasin family protein [Paraburkholderia sp. GAS448]|uniref:phasin family protein n=1 Tax=Paraburkholderia sp. GAS448 TaxID=3035136 RepID=UPI003D20C027
MRTVKAVGVSILRYRIPMSSLTVSRKHAMTDPFNAVTDFSRMLEQLKIPGVDVTLLIEAQRKDIAALTQDHRVANEGIQALVKKQAELFSRHVEEMRTAVQRMSGEDPKDAVAQQGALIQRTLTKALEEMRELTGMAQSSQIEALAVISRRPGKNLEEAKVPLRQ